MARFYHLNPKFEFSGPEVSLENLIIDAELFKPDWIANENKEQIAVNHIPSKESKK